MIAPNVRAAKLMNGMQSTKVPGLSNSALDQGAIIKDLVISRRWKWSGSSHKPFQYQRRPIKQKMVTCITSVRRWSFECHWQGECEHSADQWQCLKSHGTSPVQIEQPPHKCWLWLCGNQIKFGWIVTTFPRRHCRWWLVRGTIPKSPGFRFGEFHSNSKKSLPLIKDWDWWCLFPIK